MDVTHMAEKKSVCRILIRKRQGKRWLRIPKCR
jgi:hypothetical protein